MNAAVDVFSQPGIESTRSMARGHCGMAASETQLDVVFGILADPAPRAIVARLDTCVAELQRQRSGDESG